MINSIKRRKKNTSKLNLIPILDSVFIFIFFLLMSAQFLDIYEIGSEAPAVMTIQDVKSKKLPLNLILDINNERILVKTGLDEKIVKTISKQNSGYDLIELSKILFAIKQNNIDEETVILRPDSTVPYYEIIRVIDIVKELTKDQETIIGTNDKGKQITTRTLFNKIVFETII